MKIMFQRLIPLMFLTIITANACGQNVWESIADSHIKANVPDEKDFRNFLIRDLQSYFKVMLKKTVRAEYELLRDAPTQSGVAYPKFYAWVKIFEDSRLIDEGAVRLAAIEKKHFEVTDYLSKRDIEEKPAVLERIFPRALVESIKKRAGI
jgi:hypothetical protein